MEEKRCQNCKYFFAYYTKSKNGYFHKMPTDGHCICIELSAASRNKYIAKCLACEYWEPIELQIEERKNIVCKYIEKIAAAYEEHGFDFWYVEQAMDDTADSMKGGNENGIIHAGTD